MTLNNIHLRRWLVVGFTLICVVLYASIYVLNRKNQDVINNKEWVQHTYDVTDTAGDLFYYIQDMHIAMRGYLLTGDAPYLKTYHGARAMTWQKFKELQALTLDNMQRQKELSIFGDMLREQDDLMKRQINRKTEGVDFSDDDMRLNRKYTELARKLKGTITEGEQRLLKARQTMENKTSQNYLNSIFAVAGTSILLLIIANTLIGGLMIRRSRAEENTRRINKEMESFTYIASHDLRSPLVNLRGFASELRYNVDMLQPVIHKHLDGMTDIEKKIVHDVLDVDIPQALNYINVSVEKMDKLTKGILELSRIGKRDLKNEWVDVKQIVTKTLDSLAHQITEKNIDVKVSQILPHVKADQLSIEQVFGNVIDNAIKYLDPDRRGVIEIGGSKDMHRTLYWVKDNGRGIREEDLNKVFEIYRRAGDTKNIPGEGLGMAYVRSSLRRLGGTIWCESALGQGTTFYFTISNNWQKENLE